VFDAEFAFAINRRTSSKARETHPSHQSQSIQVSSVLSFHTNRTINPPHPPVLSHILLLPTNIPSKELRLRPIQHDQHPVPRTEAHAQIRALPEEIRHRAPRGKITALPPREGDVGNRLLRADVRQRALVRVVEWADLLDAAESAMASQRIVTNK
jgi:hypothetical protein